MASGLIGINAAGNAILEKQAPMSNVKNGNPRKGLRRINERHFRGRSRFDRRSLLVLGHKKTYTFGEILIFLAAMILILAAIFVEEPKKSEQLEFKGTPISIHDPFNSTGEINK